MLGIQVLKQPKIHFFSFFFFLTCSKLYNNGFTSIQGHAFNGTNLDAM